MALGARCIQGKKGAGPSELSLGFQRFLERLRDMGAVGSAVHHQGA